MNEQAGRSATVSRVASVWLGWTARLLAPDCAVARDYADGLGVLSDPIPLDPCNLQNLRSQLPGFSVDTL